MKHIFVLGSINYDLVIETPRMPVGGETIIGRNFMSNFGGKGANQAAVCAKLGGTTYFLAAIGDDNFGRRAVARLKDSGVNCEYVQIVSDCSTGVAVIIIENGENRIILDSGANHVIDYSGVYRVINGRICERDVFLCQLESPPDLVQMSLKLAKLNGALTILNPAPARKLSHQMLQNVDIIVPNETETEILTGVSPDSEDTLKRAGSVFRDYGIKDVIVTLGSKGCCHIGENGLRMYPAREVEVVDTTAAGDTFIGALASCLVQDKTIEESIDFCQLAASVTVQRRGAQTSIPTMAELKQLFRLE